MTRSNAIAIVNPAAGNGAAARRWDDALVQLRATWFYSIDTRLTKEPGHATELAAGARECDLVLCIGGDGTLHEVVNGLMRQPAPERPPLAILPAGTGGDVARMLRLPNDATSLITRWPSLRPRAIDVGELALMRNAASSRARALQTLYFVNIAGLGYDAAVCAAVGPATKNKASYLIQVLRTLAGHRAQHVRVHADGVLAHDGAAMMVAICNGRFFGGGMRVAPDADPGDGLFDIVILGAMSRLEFLLNFPRVYVGTHVTHPKVRVIRAREVRVESPAPLLLEAEGELLGEAPVSARLLPGALRVMCPL
jgi:YegS/Rv2252/BmrU family lipid kinase